MSLNNILKLSKIALQLYLKCTNSVLCDSVAYCLCPVFTISPNEADGNKTKQWIEWLNACQLSICLDPVMFIINQCHW